GSCRGCVHRYRSCSPARWWRRRRVSCSSWPAPGCCRSGWHWGWSGSCSRCSAGRSAATSAGCGGTGRNRRGRCGSGEARVTDQSADRPGTAQPDPPAEGPAPAGDPTPARAGRVARERVRLVAARVVTGLALALVLFALVAPSQLGYLTPEAFLRIPVEGLLGLALLLVLPPRPRRVVAVAAGLALGV